MNRAVPSAMFRAFGLAAVLVGSTATLSCNVNEYCLNCATPGDGGPGNDAVDGDVDAPEFDANDGGPCNPQPEVCDNIDNDCDGMTDEGALPTIGEACSSPPMLNSGLGECAGGVKQCVNGAVTCSKPATPETCDMLDNNCNGTADEGDPGGGALCGTNTGECVAGVNRCINGSIMCTGAIGPAPMELCNNRDDDCDGTFDEMIPSGGPCPGGTDTGLCSRGNLMCIGGVDTCVGRVDPTFELCDNLDQDCDGNNTNGYNLATDPQNCGMCGNICNLPHSFEGCAANMCTIVACEAGWHNNNGMTADGCEFGPCTITGTEVCDGVDNDCDGLVDMADPSMIVPVGLCNNNGACSTGTTLTCNGAMGWKCNYTNPNVQVDMMGNIIPETRCDSDLVTGVQADNDCDGIVDEGQPNLGAACDNMQQGQCLTTGSFVCNPADRNGPSTCNAPAGPMPAAETCDGLDNNCNGIIDDGAATGNLPGQEWISIPGTAVQMMKYEASRPDANGLNLLETHACSTAGRKPWANLTHPQAENACASVGARLCSEAEWQLMCVPPITYPVTGPSTTGLTDFVFIEAEDHSNNTTIGGAGRAWTRVVPSDSNGKTAMQVPDSGFSVLTAANALTQSSRMDYQLSLLGSTPYRVWLRMRGTGSSGGTASTTPDVTLSRPAGASTQVGDVVFVFTWSTSTNGIPTHALQAGYTQVRTQTLDDGNNDGRLSIAYRVATVAGAQTYQAYTQSGGTGVTNFTGLSVFQAGSINVAGITSASTSDNGTGAPNPPNPGNTTTRSVVFAVGAWHETPAATINVTPPGSYTEVWEMSGSHQGELSLARRTLDAAQGADPGSFGDNNTPNSTASATIVIPLSDSNSVWTGLAAGAAAGNANSTAVLVPASDQWQWVVSPQLTSGAAGLHTFSVYTREDGVLVDTIAISRQSTTTPTFDNSWAYQNNPRVGQPQTCNGDDFDTNGALAGDQDDILLTGGLAMCHANKGVNDAFDMSGNVKEWTAERAPGQNPLRGGASNNEVTGLTCDLSFTLADDTFFFPNVGYRCCR